jgi:predicted nucleic acid-binding protein
VNVVVDANVVVKWFVKEPDSTKADAVSEIDGLLVAPEHILGEVGEVLLRRLRRGDITQEQFDLARRVLPGSLVLVGLEKILDAALGIALEARLTAYDALYMATAERWDTVVVTADLRLVNSVQRTPWASRIAALEAWMPHRLERS